MPRSRNIKPGFFVNEHLVELPFSTRLLFIGLWTLADREGRLEDRPKKIKMALFPADNVDVNGAIQDLHDAGLVRRYVVNNERFIVVINFLKHQSPHVKEQDSVIPAPDMHQTCTGVAALIPDSLLLIPDPLSSESRNGEAPQEDDAVLKYYSDLTNNPVSDSDRAARKKLNGVSDLICKIGVRLSVERAAGPVRSFKYCMGAIEETAGAGLTDAAAVGYLTRLEKGEG